MSMIRVFAGKANMDFDNVTKLASTKLIGLTTYYPGYTGSTCLLKDTLVPYLWFVNTGNNRYAEMLRSIIEINELYPKYIAENH